MLINRMLADARFAHERARWVSRECEGDVSKIIGEFMRLS